VHDIISTTLRSPHEIEIEIEVEVELTEGRGGEGRGRRIPQSEKKDSIATTKSN
jgi:hypothetical protein